MRLVAGPGDVYICNLCVALCNEILAQDAPPEQPQPAETPGQWSGRLIQTEVSSG